MFNHWAINIYIFKAENRFKKVLVKLDATFKGGICLNTPLSAIMYSSFALNLAVCKVPNKTTFFDHTVLILVLRFQKSKTLCSSANRSALV